MQSSRADMQAPSVDSCARADVRCDRFHLTHYPRFFSTVQPWHLLHGPCAAASSFSGGLSNGGSCTRLLPLDIGTFCSSRTVAEEAEPLHVALPFHTASSSMGTLPTFRVHSMLFTPFPLSTHFLSSSFSSWAPAISLLSGSFSLPISELSSPSWPPAQPSCFPDPILRQG